MWRGVLSKRLDRVEGVGSSNHRHVFRLRRFRSHLRLTRSRQASRPLALRSRLPLPARILWQVRAPLVRHVRATDRRVL